MEYALTKEDLEALLENYFTRITYVNNLFLLYRHMNDSQKNNIRIINEFPAFYQLSKSAFIRLVFIELAKLYDYGSDTGIKKLLCICEANQNLFLKKFHNEIIDCETDEIAQSYDIKVNIKQDIHECRNKIFELEQIIDNVKNQRDKYYAHLDKEYLNNPEKLTKDFSISCGDIKLLLDTATNICNKMYVDLSRKQYVTQFSNWNDIDNIFEIITKYKANEKLIFEKEIENIQKRINQ